MLGVTEHDGNRSAVHIMLQSNIPALRNILNTGLNPCDTVGWETAHYKNTHEGAIADPGRRAKPLRNTFEPPQEDGTRDDLGDILDEHQKNQEQTHGLNTHRCYICKRTADVPSCIMHKQEPIWYDVNQDAPSAEGSHTSHTDLDGDKGP